MWILMWCFHNICSVRIMWWAILMELSKFSVYESIDPPHALFYSLKNAYIKIWNLVGFPVGLRCLFQLILWFSGSSSSEWHSVYSDACTLVKANLFGDLTFSVGYSLSMWISIQLQRDSNSGQWSEVFFSLNTGFFCSCSMLISRTLLGSSYQNMAYWIKKIMYLL